MLTLTINTSSQPEAIALIDSKKPRLGLVLGEISWHGQADETQKLLPNIQKLLKKTGGSFKDLKKIIVVSGPGQFTALRIGVTIGNVLAFALRIPLFAVRTPDINIENFARSLVSLPKSAFKKCSVAAPEYSKAPNITMSAPQRA